MERKQKGKTNFQLLFFFLAQKQNIENNINWEGHRVTFGKKQVQQVDNFAFAKEVAAMAEEIWWLY